MNQYLRPHLGGFAHSVPDSPSPSLHAVERILNYSFRDKTLLEEALTHSSCIHSPSYQRLEFVGDAVLSLAFTNLVFLKYPGLDPGHLSLLRAANISTEKLARVAIRHGLYHFLSHNCPALDAQISKFAEAVSQEDEAVVYGGPMKAPKILADIVESLAAAVYVDIDFDLKQLWWIIKGLFEPIITLEDLQQQPEPVTLLFQHCQKLGKPLDIKHWKKQSKNIATVFVDGKFIASGSSHNKETAKVNAVKEALVKLSDTLPSKPGVLDFDAEFDADFETEEAKQKLYQLCCRKKWPKPTYEIEKDEGPPHGRKFVCSARIPTEHGVLCMIGNEKSRVKDAENSAASFMIYYLKEKKIFNMC